MYHSHFLLSNSDMGKITYYAKWNVFLRNFVVATIVTDLEKYSELFTAPQLEPGSYLTECQMY